MRPALLHALTAFARTRWLAGALRTPDDIARRRAAALARFLRRDLLHAPFYRSSRARQIEDLPIVDKATLMADFAAFNRAGVTADQVRAALDRGEERVGDLIVGQSTGTSGNRGYYVISEAERFTWLGVLLAKALPDAPFRSHRVALALPGYSRLYASAAETGRLTLRFFELGRGLDAWRADLAAFAPDVLVAPPKVLRALAEAGDIRPRHVFSGAEVLDPLDRAAVEQGFGVKSREIYMATEGLFGVACPEGVLHLAEDVVAFEFEPDPGGGELVGPIVTDFTRRTQILARYRMNDLLRLRAQPCPCGSPLRAVEAIEGRADDSLRLGGALITPDVARNAVVDADRRILDFRVVQVGPQAIELGLDPDLPADAVEAAVALGAALRRAGGGEVEVRLTPGLDLPMDRKLRRVRRAWPG
jgi:putative adenylate-forming enzyme